jgi:hypothetical protein
MNPDERHRRIPDIKLEQYLLGELTAEELAEMKQILDGDAESRARLAALEQSNREILEQYPADVMSRRIQSSLGSVRQPRKRFFPPLPVTAALGAATALLLLWVVLPANFTTSGPGENPSAERIKGQGPHLMLYRKVGDGSEDLSDGARAYPGDIIRIGYQAAGRLYGVILSVDGRGTATLHLPHEGNRSVRLENEGAVLLDFALELDDAPRWERFYFVCSDTAFDVAPVLRAARQIDVEKAVNQAERLDLPEGLDQFVVSLKKGSQQ